MNNHITITFYRPASGIVTGRKEKKMKAQEVYSKLDNMDLSKKARNVIETTDQFAIIDLFSTCETAEEVEALVNELLED